MVAALSILAVIVALKNTEAVETKILFAILTMRRAVLLFTPLAGFALGIVAATWMGRMPAGELSQCRNPQSTATPTANTPMDSNACRQLARARIIRTDRVG